VSSIPHVDAPVYGGHISILLCIYVCMIIAFVNFQEIKEIFIYLTNVFSDCERVLESRVYAARGRVSVGCP